MQTTNKRQSREAQRNAKVQAAYESLRYQGVGKSGAAASYERMTDRMESWLCASQTQRVHPCDYLVTRDRDTGHTHCSCDAGTYGRDCIHQAAVRRAVAERAAKEARQAADDARRDTAPLRRSNRPFSLMA